MRLVIETTVGDGYTWHAIVTVPVEYESPEAFSVDFEEACLQNKNNHMPFHFAGKDWNAQNFIFEGEYYAPEIFTVDEWFDLPQLPKI